MMLCLLEPSPGWEAKKRKGKKVRIGWWKKKMTISGSDGVGECRDRKSVRDV